MAIPFDLTKKDDRTRLIELTYSSENKRRKAMSLRQTEIYNDRLLQAVYERIAARFSEETARTMPIVASINLAKRIVDQEASIYKHPPQREYENMSEQQMELFEIIREEMSFNAKMMQSNRSFKLQNQNHVMVVPKDGRLCTRVLRNHHIDKIDDLEDPEVAGGYIISSFNKDYIIKNRQNDTNRGSGFRGRFDQWTDITYDGQNSGIGDVEDYQIPDRMLVWTPEYNFIMNEKGDIISGEEIESPIPGIMPIVDISIEKDFEYWVRQGDAVGEFTIEYNVLMSDIHHIVQNQGYAQAYLVAKDDQMPTELIVGPNRVLRLPVDDSEVRPEFGFANPGSDISGAIQFTNEFLVNFLTSRGLDPDTIATNSSSGTMSSSGVQEFLRMIKRFEASKSDYDIYRKAEMQIFKIIKAWHNAAIGNPELLDPRYVGAQIPEDASCQVTFAGPEMVQTEREKLEVVEKKIDMGLLSRIEAIEIVRDVSKERAMEIALEIDGEQMGMQEPIVDENPIEEGEEDA
jgi:hypothetical protein